MSAASQARRTSNKLTIAVIEKSPYVSYAACGMPYYISNDVRDADSLVAINIDEYINERKIEIRLNTEVAAVDFTSKTITVISSAGKETIAFGKLIIATGARPVVPPIKGIDSPNIYYLRNLSDGIAIKKYIDERSPRSGIIIGGGFIGLEMAESLRKRSINTVMLEKFESVAMTMSPVIRSIITETLAVNDVTVRTHADITGIAASDAGLIVTASGDRYEGDFIIASTGIVPNTDFLKGTELAMNDRGAVIVDEKSATNLPDIYAAGDCATVKNLISGESVYLPLGTTANKQGRVAGLQAAGMTDEIFPGVVGSQMVKIFDLEVGKTGFNESDAWRAGVPSESSSVLSRSKAGYYPAASRICVSLTINSQTRELIGGETAGIDGAALRINTIATAVAARMKIEEVAYLDLGYAPPFSPVWDPVNAAAQKLMRRSSG
jgi:NADPH-dependent 2,4-dienoyl-CoA reductase/sulfur reductase-like enzyme